MRLLSFGLLLLAIGGSKGGDVDSLFLVGAILTHMPRILYFRGRVRTFAENSRGFKIHFHGFDDIFDTIMG